MRELPIHREYHCERGPLFGGIETPLGHVGTKRHPRDSAHLELEFAGRHRGDLTCHGRSPEAARLGKPKVFTLRLGLHKGGAFTSRRAITAHYHDWPEAVAWAARIVADYAQRPAAYHSSVLP